MSKKISMRRAYRAAEQMAADYYWKEMNEAEKKLGFELLILTDKYVPDEVLDIVLQYPQWIPNTPCVTFYVQNEDGKNTEDISGIGLFVPIGSERIKISLEDYNELKERSDKRFKTAIKRHQKNKICRLMERVERKARNKRKK